MRRAEIDIVPFGEETAIEARAAFARFGKGRHPAGLNLGGCAAYAPARLRSLPLLFKGDDFAKIDIPCAAA